jgi:hypothetical protein
VRRCHGAAGGARCGLLLFDLCCCLLHVRKITWGRKEREEREREKEKIEKIVKPGNFMGEK